MTIKEADIYHISDYVFIKPKARAVKVWGEVRLVDRFTKFVSAYDTGKHNIEMIKKDKLKKARQKRNKQIMDNLKQQEKNKGG